MTDADTDTDINDEESTLDRDMDELASTVVDHIDPGQTIGDKIVLSRRQLLAIAGGGLSLGALGTFGVSDAQAQSAVGTIGTASSPVDVEAARISANQLGTASNPADVEANNLNAQSVSATDASVDTLEAKSVANGFRYAGAHDGGDPDARLDNALSAASDGDVIFLENLNQAPAEYALNRTVNKPITLIGTTAGSGDGTRVEADFTFDQAATLKRINSQGNSTFTFTATASRVSECAFFGSDTINIEANGCFVTGIRGSEVVFGSTTDSGIVDSCNLTTVTDNGTNTVGDIA